MEGTVRGVSYEYQQGSCHGYRSIDGTTHPPTCLGVLVQGRLLAQVPTLRLIYQPYPRAAIGDRFNIILCLYI